MECHCAAAIPAIVKVPSRGKFAPGVPTCAICCPLTKGYIGLGDPVVSEDSIYRVAKESTWSWKHGFDTVADRSKIHSFSNGTVSFHSIVLDFSNAY